MNFRRNRARRAGFAMDETRTRQQFEAVKRWFYDDWRRIEPKLRTSASWKAFPSSSRFLTTTLRSSGHSALRKNATTRSRTRDGRYGKPLPPFQHLIEREGMRAQFPGLGQSGIGESHRDHV